MTAANNNSADRSLEDIFLRLDAQKTPDGITMEASYLPTVCVRQRTSDARRLHQAMPCREDEQKSPALSSLTMGI